MVRRPAYYKVEYPNDPRYGLAYAPPETKIVLLPQQGPVTNWTTITFSLQGGLLPDYMATNVLVRLCSQKLKTLLDRKATPADHLQWLPVKVDNGVSKQLFYILHFPDASREILSPISRIEAGLAVSSGHPVFMEDKLQGRHIFSYPGAFVRFFVSDGMKRFIQAHQCTSIRFSRVDLDTD